jgi:hypothetical protein
MPRTGDLPTTAYLVLGVLAANDEQLTAGEIKLRAEFSVGYFYWSPSVSTGRKACHHPVQGDAHGPGGPPPVGAALPEQ